MVYEIALGIIVTAGLVLILFYSVFGEQQQESRACFNGNCFTVKLALTPYELSAGLMFADHLDEDRGMLFVFEEDGIYPFTMKNTLIPLDIIWIDSNGKVVFISRNTQPCKSILCTTIDPGKQARCVLEINAGISGKTGLVVGDEMTIDFMKTQKVGV